MGHEQRLFKASNLYSDADKYQHINKHNAFLATMRGLSAPVNAQWVAFAKNWLTQHIKNTDFRYKGKMPHHVSDPYVWDESFQVYHTRLDDEHVILFKTLTWVTNPVSQEYLDWAKNWLAQHIKNTDFKYRYKLATHHHTPEPYVWNNEFEVFYKRLDEEHIGLFESMLDVENNPNDQGKIDNLQTLMRDHFYYE